MKQYKLLKDIPGAKAGSVFAASTVSPHYHCVEGEMQIDRYYLPDEVVDNNPEWFEEINQPEEKQFTKEDMRRFALYYNGHHSSMSVGECLATWIKHVK